jgi:2,4-dienoyl-CoA reductase-like NADH-dependent reductase (Old Yellow Enzyme family)/thioredoxin reductase
LFEPLVIGSMELANRIVMPPMVTNYASPEGEATPRLIDYVARRARGGVGLIIVEASYIRPDGRGFVNQLGIHRDDQIPALRRLVDAVHAEGARIAIQLYHGGRQSSAKVTGAQPLAPSAIPDPITNEIPRALAIPEIEDLVHEFGSAAARAKQAGFDAIEVHGAHGYLVAEFLSPFSNRRVDRYGGGTRGRATFAIEIVRHIREVVGENYPILFRLSGEERVEGGLTIDQTRIIAALLEEAGVDALHVSIGNYATPGGLIFAPMDVERGPLTALAAAIKQVVSIPVIAVDRLHDPLLAEQVLQSGQADLVAIGRGLLADPDLPNKARRGELADILPCIACNQACITPLLNQEPISCLLNPACGREAEFAIQQTAQPKRVLVIGGGPAGLEATRVLVARGHQACLVEEDDTLGGEFVTAAIPPKKEEIADAIQWMIRQVERSGATVKLHREVTMEWVEQFKPDAVIIATGAEPVRPPIEGIAHKHVVVARDVLLGTIEPGNPVLVVGGGPVGLETAEYLAVQMRQVTLLEPSATVGHGLEAGHRYWVLDTLRRAGVTLLDQTRLQTVFRDGTVLVGHAGSSRVIGPFAAVVLAMGYAPRNGLHDQIQQRMPETYLIGDAATVRSAVEAIREANEVARQI